MEKSSILNSMKFIVPILFLQLLYTGVFSYICPETCKCVFNYTAIGNNQAVCRTGSSIVNFDWYIYEKYAALTVTCNGTHYKCSELPQFHVRLDTHLMTINYCSPNILRCALNFHKYPFLTRELRLKNSIGVYTKEDVTILNKLWVKFLLLQETEENSTSHLPGGILRDVNTLNSLELEGNISGYTHITPDVFSGIYLLRHLRLFNNKLKSIDPDALSNLINLQVLTIRRNMLSFLPNKLFDKLEKFYEMNIVDNLVNMTLDTHAFAHLPKQFEVVHVDNSKITKLPKDVLSGSDSLKTITFCNNSIETLPSKIFWTTSSITHINFSYNQIKVLPVAIFSKLKNLQNIDFSYNNIETLNGDLFSFNSELEEVFLQNNNIRHFDFHVFKKTKLQDLSLASNKVERIVGCISSSWKLRTLILRDNNLTEFEHWLTLLPDLEYLDLSSNKINKIKESLIYTWHSIDIDLRYNNITNIEQKKSEHQKSIANNRNISIYLSNNPLECDCSSNLIIKNWYDNGSVPDFKEIICAKGEYLSKIDVDLECNKGRAFIVSIGTKVIGGLVLTIICASIYTRREQIWDNIISLCKFNSNTTIINEERREAIRQYDIFISFAHQDCEFITDQLLPKLEYEYGQKVCVHYRDWIVGELIPDQIIQSVENSIKTIIVLSKHFLISEWSQLEFRTAHNLSKQEGKSRVIVILFDEKILEDENIDHDLRSYIALKAYLLWWDPNFWKKLKNVLPKPRKVSREEDTI